MAPFFAFLHHLAAFTLVSAIAVEFVLTRDALTVKSARTLQVADLVVGISAAVVLVAGILRVVYFEKGTSYYLGNAAFIAKMVLFGVVALLSIAPTVEFLSWSKSLKQGRAPEVSERKMSMIRFLIHCELAGIVLLLLCAALMAKGVGNL